MFASQAASQNAHGDYTLKLMQVCRVIATKISYSSTTTCKSCNKWRVREQIKKVKSSPYSITERRVPELIPVLGSQPAGDVSHKPGGRLPLLSARPAVTPATLTRAATNFAA